MNHRERILAAIHHQPIDRIPTDMWATDEVYQKLFKHLHVNNVVDLYDTLDIDGIMGISPMYIGRTLRTEDGYREDEWGMGYRLQAFPTGVYEEQMVYPLAEAETIADLEAYAWPSPDWYDYHVLPERATRFPGRAIECGYTAVFYYHNKLRGLELSLMDPLLRPEFTHYLLKRLSQFFTEYHQRCFEAGNGIIDTTQVTDDFGSQRGLLISRRIFEEFYREPMQNAIDLAKTYNLIVFHHDDGDMRPLLQVLVEMGINVLNPIQWRCGDWNLAALKTGFGEHLCFHGGVDNQQTLPFGNPGDVRSEVKWLIETLASDRTGLIMAPCHNFQPNTPVENILALYQAVREFGTFTRE